MVLYPEALFSVASIGVSGKFFLIGEKLLKIGALQGKIH